MSDVCTVNKNYYNTHLVDMTDRVANESAL